MLYNSSKMKKTIIQLLLLFTSFDCSGQSWEQVGDFNKPSINRVFYDSITQLMFISSKSRFNGPDTVDGFFSFDGALLHESPAEPANPFPD
jgi:hypothetical protein